MKSYRRLGNGKEAESVNQSAQGSFEGFQSKSHPDAVARPHAKRQISVRRHFGAIFRTPSIRIEIFRVRIILLQMVKGINGEYYHHSLLKSNTLSAMIQSDVLSNFSVDPKGRRMHPKNLIDKLVQVRNVRHHFVRHLLLKLNNFPLYSAIFFTYSIY